MPILIPETKISTLAIKEVDFAIIGVNAYCTACKLKKAHVFALSIRNLKYQAKKKTRPKTNSKSIVLEEYHNFLDVFSKKNSDILSSHQKYDYKTIFEEEQKYSHALFYKMLL